MVLKDAHGGKEVGGATKGCGPAWVNQATVRQTHYREPPFQKAMSVKPGRWRFSGDTWNGYHSVPLIERDRHITTFITHERGWLHLLVRHSDPSSQKE